MGVLRGLPGQLRIALLNRFEERAPDRLFNESQSEQNTKLFRSYFHRPGGAAFSRPRGRSPRQASFFLRNPRLEQEAAFVASLWTLLGALPLRRQPRSDQTGRPDSTPRGFAEALALCEAYEAYRVLVPTAHISFEHMDYLHDALGRGDELKLASCSGCGALLVAERVALIEPRCVYCAGLASEYASDSGGIREAALP